jgi:membrane associated rhomboid family serine protease
MRAAGATLAHRSGTDMLILPLHRPLTRATFPFAAALLVLVNLLVFFGPQRRDEAALETAATHYVESGLAAIEMRAYERHLERGGRSDALREWRAVPEDARPPLLMAQAETDMGFRAALDRGELFEAGTDAARYAELRVVQARHIDRVFTLQHLLRGNEIDPWRMFASAFLHADAMHLIGNLVFLVALGLLVEGALGSLRFLGLYAIGALGASAASLAWRWGDPSGGLGASGAVAALMGAFCVIWGRRPVRFFYWLVVVFDYVRAPAIWLLPAWLGWELLNLLFRPDAGIAFDAHAGGLVTGAIVGLAFTATRQVRSRFIDDPHSAGGEDDRWARAQALLGRMRLDEADALLTGLVAEQPQRLDVRLARYRIACNGARADIAQRGLDVLAVDARDAAGIDTQLAVLRELDAAGHAVPGGQRQTLAMRWLDAGALGAAETALAGIAPAASGELAALWFRLALAHGPRDAGAQALRIIVDRFADSPQARKARFLLDNA